MVKEDHAPQVLRLDDNQLQIWHYDPVTRRAREVKQNHHEAAIHQRIATSLKKPDPMVLEAVIAVNKRLQRIKEDDKIIMIGDRYQTDIACGNLAGIDTALVKPYRPLSDKLSLILARYLMDAPIGAMMSKLAERS